MYLLVTPSPYSGDLLNYKSLDYYQNFLSGWVEVLVRSVTDDKGVERRLVTAKVSNVCFLYVYYMYNNAG